MSNLIEIKRDYIINTLSALKAGVYTDTIEGKKALVFRELGITMFAGETAGADFGSIAAATVAGTAKVALYKLNNAAPLDATDYDVAVRVDPIYKDPGVDKAMYYSAPTFGGVYSVAVSGSTITPASIRAIIDDMSEQCYSDTENTFLTLGMGFVITGWSTSNAVVINGTSYDDDALAGLVTKINAGDDAYAYAISATSYAIILKSAFVSLTTESTVDTDVPFLGIISNSVDVQFDTYFSRGLLSSTILAAGVFPRLTSAEIDKIVRNKGNHGDLTIFADGERPIAGTAYTKFHIWTTTTAYNNHTPGMTGPHKQVINLYVPTSQISVNYWDADDYNDVTGGTPDTNFTGLLAAWKA